MHPAFYRVHSRQHSSGMETAGSAGMNTALSHSFRQARPDILSFAAKHCSPSMIALVLLFTVAQTLVLMDPQRIPGWCALGAVIATVYVFVHEKYTSTNIKPGFLFLNALCTLFAGIALPRPVLTHWFNFTNLGTWYPESFVIVAALCGICGFTIMHTIYLTITGELPNVIRSLTNGFIRKFFPADRPPVPPPTPGPPGI